MCAKNRSSSPPSSRAGPEYRPCGIVLPDVAFYFFQHPSAAERIAVPVDKAARCAGVFEAVPLLPGVQLRGAGAAVRMGVHVRQQRFQPPGRGDLDVRIDEQEILVQVFQGQESAVVAAGEAVIPVQGDDAHLRELRCHQPQRSVRGCIVGHDDLAAFRHRCNQSRKESPQKSLRVPVQYDHRSFLHGSAAIWYASCIFFSNIVKILCL